GGGLRRGFLDVLLADTPADTRSGDRGQVHALVRRELAHQRSDVRAARCLRRTLTTRLLGLWRPLFGRLLRSLRLGLGSGLCRRRGHGLRLGWLLLLLLLLRGRLLLR